MIMMMMISIYIYIYILPVKISGHPQNFLFFILKVLFFNEIS